MTTPTVPLKRIKRKVKVSRNPLFEKWLKEWKEEAVKNGSEMQYCFNKALKALKMYPVKLNSGKECMVLENFGSKICKMLDDRLEQYKATNPNDLILFPPTNRKKSIGDIGLDAEEIKTCETNVKKRKSDGVLPQAKKKIDKGKDSETNNKKNSEYVPAYRSGAYAILIALYKESQKDDFKGFMTKAELQECAQDFCDSSFTKPLPGSHYTAWSSMAVLIRKDLTSKQGNPAKFSLTEKGVNLVLKLKLAEDTNHNDSCVEETPQITKPFSPVKEIPVKVIKKSKEPVNEKKNFKTKSSAHNVENNCLTQSTNNEEKIEHTSEPDETIFLLPHTFEIILLADTQERDNKFQQSNQMTLKELKSRGVNFEIRHLKVGDFIWIARDIHSGQELVLPYIVERKRMDDLASSIKDGRFHEQKFRLKQSGIENLIYLVEKYGNENQRLGLPLPTLHQAISNTQILGGFTVKVTDNHNHSMRYLHCMTTQLTNIFKSKTLMSCKKSNLSPATLSDDLIALMTFMDFNKGSEKNKKSTVQSMLVKHLLQFNGLSVEKAKAIVQVYPTPKALMEALKRPNGKDSIAELTYGGLNRSIGPVAAKQIHMLYTMLDLQ